MGCRRRVIWPMKCPFYQYAEPETESTIKQKRKFITPAVIPVISSWGFRFCLVKEAEKSPTVLNLIHSRRDLDLNLWPKTGNSQAQLISQESEECNKGPSKKAGSKKTSKTLYKRKSFQTQGNTKNTQENYKKDEKARLEWFITHDTNSSYKQRRTKCIKS